MEEPKTQLTKPVKIGEYAEVNIDNVVYPAKIVGADYTAKTIVLKIDWEVKKK